MLIKAEISAGIQWLYQVLTMNWSVTALHMCVHITDEHSHYLVLHVNWSLNRNSHNSWSKNANKTVRKIFSSIWVYYFAETRTTRWEGFFFPPTGIILVLIVFLLNGCSKHESGLFPVQTASLKSSVSLGSCEGPTPEPSGGAAEKRMKGLSLEKATGVSPWFYHLDQDCQTLTYSPWCYSECFTLWKSASLQQASAL